MKLPTEVDYLQKSTSTEASNTTGLTTTSLGAPITEGALKNRQEQEDWARRGIEAFNIITRRYLHIDAETAEWSVTVMDTFDENGHAKQTVTETHVPNDVSVEAVVFRAMQRTHQPERLVWRFCDAATTTQSGAQIRLVYNGKWLQADWKRKQKRGWRPIRSIPLVCVPKIVREENT